MSQNQQKLREKYKKRFDTAYNKLNPEQKNAVDQIEGSVMVIAGPGTGKTQILAVRIGNILLKQDIKAHNILCLTFTDAATVAMRNRLVEIIGPEGHKVHIYTFHSFCNQVIQENLGYFGNYRKLDQLSDLEKLDVYSEIIDSLPQGHRLKRPKGDPQYEAKRLEKLFEMMKKENLDTQDIEDRIQLYYQKIEDGEFPDGKFFYKRKHKEFKAGDKNPNKWKELEDRMDDLSAGAQLFSQYNDIMHRIGRYDYADMILWVVKAFKENDDILSNYQERYQYYLVDEYQDTNGAQNQLLYSLIDFMDMDPNVFVVGDDDQAIYKFQGANLNNIKEFNTKYKPNIVVLEKNYRSCQPILDAASDLIDFNLERMIKETDLFTTKDLIAAGPLKGVKNIPQVREYSNVIHEQADLVRILHDKFEDGENLDEIAVIYRNHKQVDKLVEVLEKKKIPINIKRRIDILKLPLIKNVLNILYYIQSEFDKPDSQEDRLFKLMHYHFFNIHARDIAKIALFKNQRKNHKKNTWRDIISDNKLLDDLDLKSSKDIERLNDLLSKWTADIANLTLQSLFGEIINQGHILQSVLRSSDKTWKLQVISTLFDMIKDESKKKPDITLREFLANIDKMKNAELPIAINKVVSARKGVHFITAHSAKGLEFDTVFIIAANKNTWDVNRSNFGSFSYPKTVNADVENNIEDERRLFFVAMTRAKSQLYISYSVKREDEKDLSKSVFVDELLKGENETVQNIEVSENSINEFQYLTMFLDEKEIKLIDNDLISEVLKKYKLSVTHLNKYLKCPMTFYFETILRVPTARNKHMGFGNAIHSAFQDFYEKVRDKKEVSKVTLLESFKSAMMYYWSHFTDKEFRELLEHGVDILDKYYEEYIVKETHENVYFLEEKVDNAEWEGVPIKGVLDKVEVFKDYVNVTDYKTGNGFKQDTKNKLKEPNARDVLGGDYWRQIVFYKILLDSNRTHNWNMISGEMDFVEPKRNTSEFFREKIVIQPHHIEMVGEQIVETWNNIQEHKFDNLCDNEKCYWCNFVREDYVFSGEFDRDGLEDDQNF